MASPVQLLDDDEDFDWDAAIKEIDIACSRHQEQLQQKQQPPPQPPPETAVPSVGNFQNRNLKKPVKNSGQLTLDSFISNGNSKPSSENPVNGFKAWDVDEKTEDKSSACYVDIDPEAAKTWIYPDNVPRREYQLAIAKTALFSNTLVALPTGLGKTLIAAVVMYNYFRWFPQGKIVFAAPSRPLVMQQIEACHNIVGIPQEWTIDMTGLTSPPKRAALWKSKRVFFVTPQVLEKDIQSGTCLAKYLVCLVIDEAHRAMGNCSYCVAIRELMAIPVDLRILALTATPGSKQQTIQQVIDNLQISTLEYRSEDDYDVCPYVHNRKIELIQVSMGKPAIEVHNLLVEVIRPIAARLSSMSLLPPRDFQTLSPCDLLNSRDKFRQAPPPELSHLKYGEVEGSFGVLITLYHIRKLLTSHGIRPAHEMLEEKLRQGFFARYMCRNESIQRAKLLMEQNLSHGAPSPKLTKMLEVLADHFKTNDPQNSRVIIFSNFRGSVRDILDSLRHLGNSVKATQFIGQNSGKTLKGQSQKVQQAVLEKFRTGGYNVIVATSIGEEGLDIMEVDLVICFDANVSPLRMIQRMGRTGRKHDGRVVVLACEGAELKSYMRKQATGKSVRKHMQNGGMNSFNFHSSPRMVPHCLKPELQFQEISIEKFVRHTKKVKNDVIEEPTFHEKLSDAETSLLGKYFSPHEEISKPSLIAFPHFQAFPSRVHRVMHSSRTGWLIDVMQLLQGIPFSTTGKTSDLDLCPQASPNHGLPSGIVEPRAEGGRDLLEHTTFAGAEREMFDYDLPGYEPTNDEEIRAWDHDRREPEVASTPTNVSPSNIYVVPDSPIHSGCSGHSTRRSQLHSDARVFEATVSDSIATHMPTFEENCKIENVLGGNVIGPIVTKTLQVGNRVCEADIVEVDLSPRLTNLIESGFVPESPLGSQDGEYQHEVLVPEPNSSSRSHRNPSTHSNDRVDVNEAPQTRHLDSSVEDGECEHEVLVPEPTSSSRSLRNPPTHSDARVHVNESPKTRHMDTSHVEDDECKHEVLVPEPTSSFRSLRNPPTHSNERVDVNEAPQTGHMDTSPVRDQIRNPIVDETSEIRGIPESPSNPVFRTTPQNSAKSDRSEDWRMSSGEKSGTGERPFRLKRLRKIGDIGKDRPQNDVKRLPSNPAPRVNSRNVRRLYNDARDFMDVEAEVSSEDVVHDSEDDEGQEDSDAYEDSFIDDRIEPTIATSQADDGPVDMMAVYRRSLLTQSPFQGQQSPSTVVTPQSMASIATTTAGGECSEKISNQETPQGYSKSPNLSAGKNSISSRFNLEKGAISSTNGRSLLAKVNTGSREHKTGSTSTFAPPVKNLEKDFSFHSGTSSKEPPPPYLSSAANGDDPCCANFSDDQIFEGIDLDALEAEAAQIISQRTRSAVPSSQNPAFFDSPSFDLGIW